MQSTQYNFFILNEIMPNINSNIMILIPKVKGDDKLDSSWPITLANFQFKIITKILDDRLGVMTSKIVSQRQKVSSLKGIFKTALLLPLGKLIF